MQTPPNPESAGKELSPELRNVLMAIGRGLGTISVYGTEHPSVGMIVNETFNALKEALKTRNLVIGSHNGSLTVNEKPVVVSDMPIRTLEKRLVAMKVSHLVLHAGLSEEELKQLLIALCSTSDEKMKETLSKGGVKNIELEDVKYVTLRSGEKKTGNGGGGDGDDEIPQPQVSQIVAFLKGQPGVDADSAGLKKAISDPEKLGKMILEAAAVRQKTGAIDQGESLADIVVGCLRRTYDGLTSESDFQSAQGKATLAKTMLLVEKTIVDKIRGSAGAESAGLNQRIMAGIRDMGKERQFDMLSTHYEEQCSKREKTEKSLIELIKQLGPEKAREQLMASNIPVQDWQRLITQSKTSNAGPSGGVDIGAIATVLDKLDGLLQLAASNPAGAKNAVMDARQGISDYTLQAESQMSEMEAKVQESKGEDRDKLILEISKLTLSLMQPLTVINGSIEAAMMTPDPALHKDLLELAYESGQSLDAMTKRMIELTDYPELNEADDPLNEWHPPQ
jgi:hypothetical protein